MSISELETKVDDKTLANALDFFKLAPGIDEDIVKMDILAARNDIIGQVGNQIDNFFDDNAVFDTAVLIEAYTLYNNRDIDSTADIFSHPGYHYLVESLKNKYLVQEALLKEHLKSDYDDMLSMYGPDVDIEPPTDDNVDSKEEKGVESDRQSENEEVDNG